MKRIGVLNAVGVSLLGVAFVAGFSWSAHAADAETPRTMTFSEAVNIAVESAPAAKISAFGEQAARSRVKSAKAQRLPKLNVTSNLLRWNDKIEVALGKPAGPGEMPTPKLLARDQVTMSTNVTLAQPITALVALSRLVKIEENAAGGAKQEAAQGRLDAAQRAAEAYLRLLQAKAFATVANQALAQVEAQLKTAQAFEQAGALSHVDVLRLTSSRQNARQNVLKADTTVVIAQGALGLALNLPQGTSIDAVDDLPEKPSLAVADEAAVVSKALQTRPEVGLAQTRRVQAEGAKTIAKAAMLPNLLALATYQNLQGQGPFQPKNAWYVGLSLNWDVWDWGKVYHDVQAAQAATQQADVGATTLGDQIAFDVHRRVLEAKTAFDTLDVAQGALGASEEAYRIQNVRFKEGAATTTDVIDSESEVSRARNGFAQARYDYFLAQAALARAVGQLPAVDAGNAQ